MRAVSTLVVLRPQKELHIQMLGTATPELFPFDLLMYPFPVPHDLHQGTKTSFRYRRLWRACHYQPLRRKYG